jgi:hypothetical protein
MAPSLALGGLQRWMQAVITHPGDVDAALASPEAASLVDPASVGDVVRPSATLAPAARVGIYQGMYLLRMQEALETDYPALAHFLGEERWRELVRDYVDAHPSRSYTLNVLGRSLAEFVRAWPGLRHAGFGHDLALLEWAVTEAFDAPGSPVLSEADLVAVPEAAWERARLVPSAALHLLALGHYAVHRVALTRGGFALLADLVEGRLVGEAVARALRRGRPRPTGEQVFGWFREWARAGVFQGVDV